MEPSGRTIRQRPGPEEELHIRPAPARSGDTTVLRIRGAVSPETSRTLDHYLRTRVAPESRHLALDLSATTLLSAAGVRVLSEHARRLAATGRRLSLIAPSSHVSTILKITGAGNVFNMYDTVSLAVVDAAKSGMQPRPTPDSGYDEILMLRRALHTKQVVAQAVGLLQGRYGFADADNAFQLLENSARRHNLAVHHLARALLAAPSPSIGPSWFPDRRRRGEPLLSFSTRPSGRRHDYFAVLGSYFSAVLKYFATTMGALHLAVPPSRAVWLERRQGVSTQLARHLVDPHHDLQPCVTAVAGRKRVIITDVATCASIPDGVRSVLAESGIRSLHCTPVVGAEDECYGTITAFHPARGYVPAALECAKTDHAVTELADWLGWHQDTVVMDALEDLHQRA